MLFRHQFRNLRKIGFPPLGFNTWNTRLFECVSRKKRERWERNGISTLISPELYNVRVEFNISSRVVPFQQISSSSSRLKACFYSGKIALRKTRIIDLVSPLLKTGEKSLKDSITPHSSLMDWLFSWLKSHYFFTSFLQIEELSNEFPFHSKRQEWIFVRNLRGAAIVWYSPAYNSFNP